MRRWRRSPRCRSASGGRRDRRGSRSATSVVPLLGGRAAGHGARFRPGPRRTGHLAALPLTTAHSACRFSRFRQSRRRPVWGDAGGVHGAGRQRQRRGRGGQRHQLPTMRGGRRESCAQDRDRLSSPARGEQPARVALEYPTSFRRLSGIAAARPSSTDSASSRAGRSGI